MPERLILFIDGQNMYRGARRAYFSDSDPHVNGQFSPHAMGQRIIARGGLGGLPRVLEQVRIYTGQPDASKQSRAYAAQRQQIAAWQVAGVHVVTRPLRYPPTWPAEKAEEKGIDVQLAIDFVDLAIAGAYDVGVIASTDTDLKPPLELVRRRYAATIKVEVAAWNVQGRYSPRLSIRGANLWCHWLHNADYTAVADTRDYNV